MIRFGNPEAGSGGSRSRRPPDHTWHLAYGLVRLLDPTPTAFITWPGRHCFGTTLREEIFKPSDGSHHPFCDFTEMFAAKAPGRLGRCSKAASSMIMCV